MLFNRFAVRVLSFHTTEFEVAEIHAPPIRRKSPENTDADGQRNGKPPPKGHGRNGAEAYRGAERIEVPHPLHQVGDACPQCGKGTLYQQKPSVIVRIAGQAPLGATVYQLQKLRCGLCGEVFTAELPPEAGKEKYDAKAGAMIGLLKCGSGLPFNRLEGPSLGHFKPAHRSGAGGKPVPFDAQALQHADEQVG